jgi:hypothetical protein
MEEVRNAYKIYSEFVKGIDHFGDMALDERKVLKQILEKYDLKVWSALNCLIMGSNGGLLGTSHWTLGSIQLGSFFTS